MRQWDIFVGDTKHEIAFEKVKLSGKALISVDGQSGFCTPVVVKKVGMLYAFDIDGSEIVLKLDMHNKPQDIIQDGVYLETGQPVEDEVLAAFRTAALNQDPLIQSDKAQMGSFLSFVILTFVNPILILLDAPFVFPFSAIIPQLIVEFGMNNVLDLYPAPNLFLCMMLALIFASAILLLYLLAVKRTWPVIVTLVFVSIDTAVVVFLAVGEFTYFIIDIAFHAWVLWSLIKLIRTRGKIKKSKAAPA